MCIDIRNTKTLECSDLYFELFMCFNKSYWYGEKQQKGTWKGIGESIKESESSIFQKTNINYR